MQGLGYAVLVGTVLLVASGCGAQAKPAAKPATTPVTGSVKVDDMAGVRYRRAHDDCAADGDLADTLTIGNKAVVIKDPNGKEVALGEISAGQYQTYTDRGTEYVVPGVCTFPFKAGEVPKVDGIYTATIPDLGIEGHFKLGDPAVIKYKP